MRAGELGGGTDDRVYAGGASPARTVRAYRSK